MNSYWTLKGCYCFVVLGAIAAGLWYGGADFWTAEGEDTLEGRTEAWCEAVEAWQGRGGSQALDSYVFTLRNPLGGLETTCSTTSASNAVVASVKTLQHADCSFEDKRVVCDDLAAVIPEPEHTVGYELELYSQQEGDSDRSLVGSFTFYVARLLETNPPRSNSNGESQQKKSNDQADACEQFGGEPEQLSESALGGLLSSQSVKCRLLFEVKSQASGRGPCYVMRAEAGGGFGWAGSMWPGLWEGLRVSNWDSRLIKPYVAWNAQPEMEVRGLPTEQRSSDDAVLALLAQSSVEFRLDGDPIVAASRMTDSTFDFGLSKATMALVGLVLMIFAGCFTCCSSVFCVLCVWKGLMGEDAV